MGLLDYYHRSHEDGGFETICTRCFASLGRGAGHAELIALEAGHTCPAEAPATLGNSESTSEAQPARNPSASPGRFRSLLTEPTGLPGSQILLLLLAGLLCLYLLPTVVEMELMRRIGPWIACVLLGDLAGCSFLSFGWGWKRTGALLYLLLTGCEGVLYGSGLLSRTVLPWVVDVAPTLLVLTLITISSFHLTQAEM
jgi:hypothetical protein